MKREIVALFILFVLMQSIFTGCGAGKVNIAPSGGKALQTFEDKGAAGMNRTIPIGENTGIITDTVVDVFREPDVQSERVTQAIYNQPANILELKDKWSRVEVVDGYTGWIKSKYIDKNYKSILPAHYKHRIIVTDKTKRIYSSAKNGVTLKDVVMGTELFCVEKVEDWYQVALPENGSGWINESGTIQLSSDEHIPETTAADFVLTVAKFKGTTYLWGGVSAWGIDCSGLMYICAHINGIDLPRDVDQQFDIGKAVLGGIDSMKPGDLVFFSTDDSKIDKSHIGVYIGNNQFLNASKSKGSVTVNSLEEDYFKKRLVGVKRIFQS